MEGDVVAMQEIFRFDRRSVGEDGEVIGDYVATGLRSNFSERFEQWGVKLPRDIFTPKTGFTG